MPLRCDGGVALIAHWCWCLYIYVCVCVCVWANAQKYAIHFSCDHNKSKNIRKMLSAFLMPQRPFSKTLRVRRRRRSAVRKRRRQG